MNKQHRKLVKGKQGGGNHQAHQQSIKMLAKRGVRSLLLGIGLVLVLAVCHVNYHVVDSHSHRQMVVPLSHQQYPSTTRTTTPKPKLEPRRREVVAHHRPLIQTLQDDPNKPYFVLHVGPPKVSVAM